MQIGVIGSFGTINQIKQIEFKKEEINLAEKLGALLAEKNAKIILGGDDNGGLIEAVARGAKSKNGLVIGLLIGKDKSKAMKNIDIIIPSGMFFGGREYLLALSCDAIIALKGGAGTLNEITIAYQNKIPIIALKGIGGWTDKLANQYLDERKRELIYETSSPKEAVELAIKLTGDKIK